MLGSVSPPRCTDSREFISPHDLFESVLAHVTTQAVVWVSTFKGMSIGVPAAQCCSVTQLTATNRLASVAVMSSTALDASRMGIQRSVLIQQLLIISVPSSDAPHIHLWHCKVVDWECHSVSIYSLLDEYWLLVCLLCQNYIVKIAEISTIIFDVILFTY